MMKNLRVRFEQKRGHYMVVEGKEPWKQKDCDEFQLRMLRACDVPGVLKLEAAALDGDVIFRYSLDGTRMLSALMKAEKWTMAEWMAVLCRLAEILEECRLYMLDEERFCLGEDMIFAGEAPHDLRLAYLPLLEERPPLAERLHLLVIRWISYVKEPDGRVLQHLLQLLSSPDFKPAALRSFARQYLLEQSLNVKVARPQSSSAISAADSGESQFDGESGGARYAAGNGEAQTAGEFGGAQTASEYGSGSAERLSGGESAAASPAFSDWRWFPPSRSSAAVPGLSGSPDEEQESAASIESQNDWPDEQEASSEHAESGNGRRKIWLICAAAGLAAVGWRWGYAEHPGTSGLILSIGVTLLSAAGSLLIWHRLLRGDRRSSKAAKYHADSQSAHSPSAASLYAKMLPGEQSSPYSLPQDSVSREDKNFAISTDGGHKRHDTEYTVMLHGIEDFTQQLAEGKSETPAARASSLLWETAPGTPLIPLTADSFLIGRSREACAHVDNTSGVSRVHLELMRTEEGWTAKDLGSRNGSKLNGVPMVAYAIYPLQKDDCLELSGSRYRLK